MGLEVKGLGPPQVLRMAQLLSRKVKLTHSHQLHVRALSVLKRCQHWE